MPLAHGHEIGAGEVEREVSGWDAVRFARLCNALAWASAWREMQTLPAFTERVIVADNGIDAHWRGELTSEYLSPNPLVIAGVTSFSIKSARSRSRREVSSPQAWWPTCAVLRWT